ncbi:hypothetical protein CR513_06888, partial [Mucuna pruriens]
MAKDKVITLGPNELPNLVSSYRLEDRNYLQWTLYIRTTLKGNKKLSHIEGNSPPRDDPKTDSVADLKVESTPIQNRIHPDSKMLTPPKARLKHE